jgi:magnesium chelatase subunit I
MGGGFVLKRYIQLIQHKGNESLFKMLELSILSLLNENPLHIHATGLRGTGKTTAIRAVREFLPPIRRIKGCDFNCIPEKPHCPLHRGLTTAEIDNIGVELIPMPFLEISHSAKLGTVVGSIDLEKIIDPKSPQAALLPGTIPKAHRGIIFVDEINRLADTAPELADALLDVMGTKPGRIQIEETGIKAVELPVCVSVWAASNPDEEPGALEDIRKQLSDRFDYLICVERPDDIDIVRQILKAGIEDGNTYYPSTLYAKAMSFLENSKCIKGITVPKKILDFLTSTYIENGLESIRGVESILLGAKLHCASQNRHEITARDISFITPLALKHRVSPQQLADILKKTDELELHSNDENKVTNFNVLEKETPAKDKTARTQNPNNNNLNALSKVSEYLSRWFSKRSYNNTNGRSASKSNAEQNNRNRETSGRKSTENSKNGTAGGGNPANETDPEKLPLVAPPNKALLVRDHSADEIITTLAGDKSS